MAKRFLAHGSGTWHDVGSSIGTGRCRRPRGRQSPIYGDGKTRMQYYRDGTWRDAIQFCKDMLHQNYFIVPLVGLLVFHRPSAPMDLFLMGWIVSVYLATHTDPFCACPARHRNRPPVSEIRIGADAGAFWRCMSSSSICGSMAILVVALALEARQYVLIAGNMRRDEAGASAAVSSELRSLIGMLKEERARVICLPAYLCDLDLSFRTSRLIGVRIVARISTTRLAAFYPVLRRRIEDYAADDGLTHLLIDQRYVTVEELGLSSGSVLKQTGSYACSISSQFAVRSLSSRPSKYRVPSFACRCFEIVRWMRRISAFYFITRRR